MAESKSFGSQAKDCEFKSGRMDLFSVEILLLSLQKANIVNIAYLDKKFGSTVSLNTRPYWRIELCTKACCDGFINELQEETKEPTSKVLKASIEISEFDF